MQTEILKYSATAIDEFLSCRRKYYYDRVLNIQPVERPEALDFGAAVHKGLESIFRSIANADDASDVTNAMEIAREYALQAVREYCDEHCISTEGKCKAVALVDMYVDSYFEHDLNLFEVLAIESYFDVPFSRANEHEIKLHGYFDAVARARDSDAIYVIEHKTTGMMSDAYVDRAFIDLQVLIYMDACKKVYGRCDGVIYDIISKPRHSMKEGETDEEFEARKAASKTGRIKRKEAETESEFIHRIQNPFDPETFHRELIMPTDIKEYDRISELAEITRQMATLYHKKQYYHCPGNCLKFGACPYMDLCRGRATVDNLGNKYINCTQVNEECNDD